MSQSKFSDRDTEETRSKKLRTNTLGNSSQFSHVLERCKSSSSSTANVFANRGIAAEEVRNIINNDLHACCPKAILSDGTAGCCCFLKSFRQHGSFNCDWDTAISVFKHCHDLSKDKDSDELNFFYQRKFSSCVDGVAEQSGKLIMKYTINEIIGGKSFNIPCCNKVYLKAYNISEHMWKKCAQSYKLFSEPVTNLSQRKYADDHIHNFTYEQTEAMIEANLKEDPMGTGN